MPASLEHQERMLKHLERQRAMARKRGTGLRVTAHALELAADQRYCTCCEKPLARKFAWLELDQRIHAYHDFGEVPEDRSQGWFPFGLTCAAQKVAEAARLRCEAA